MDTLTKKLVDKAAAYNSAFEELHVKDSSIKTAEYIDETDTRGKFVRAYVEHLGYSDKYYYE